MATLRSVLFSLNHIKPLRVVDGTKLQSSPGRMVTLSGKGVVQSGNEQLHLFTELSGGCPGLFPEHPGEIGFLIVSQFITYL